MKSIKLTFLSLAALLGAHPSGYCTANADASASAPAIPPELQKQLDDQAAQIAELKKKLDSQSASPAPEPPTGTLAYLAKGAGVDLEDVRWRVQSGLDPETAVQAAVAQKQHNDAAAERAAEEAASKSKKK